MASPNQMTTGRVRFSYVYLAEPKTNEDGTPGKYSVTLLIPKTDKVTLGKIKDAISAAKAIYVKRNPGRPLPTNLKSTIHDGDGERPSGGEFGPECKGNMVMTVSSKTKPILVYADKTPIVDPLEIYSGCYGRAVLSFYVYDTAGNKGVSAGLNGIMKISDGEPLGGNVVVDADWDDGWEKEE